MPKKVPSAPSTATSKGSTSPATKAVPSPNDAAPLATKRRLPNSSPSGTAVKQVSVDGGKNRPKKSKNIRYSCQMPESEYTALKELKSRLAGLEMHVKKSELVRAGLLLLAGLPERRLKIEVAKILEQGKSEKKST